MLRCERCKEPIIDEVKYQEWLELKSMIYCLYLQEEITLETYKHMTDLLMTFKVFAFDDKEDNKEQ